MLKIISSNLSVKSKIDPFGGKKASSVGVAMAMTRERAPNKSAGRWEKLIKKNR